MREVGKIINLLSIEKLNHLFELEKKKEMCNF